MFLSVQSFPVQAVNVKGMAFDILELKVPKSNEGRRYNLAVPRKALLYIPLGQYFTVTNGHSTNALTPTLTLDYPIAPQPASPFSVPVGDNIVVYYSTDGTNFTKGTKVSGTPANNGEFQVTSESDGTIKVYVPASSTRYFRVFYRPNEGRLSLVRKPSVESQDEFAKSLVDFGLPTLHTMDQVRAGGGVFFPSSAVFGVDTFISLRLFMPDKTATQSSESNITKTVTRASLFVPYSVSTVPWSDEVGAINIPYDII